MNYLSNDNVQEILNLSRLQKSIMTQQENESPARQPIEQLLVQLQGRVDAERFQQAWDEVIDLHPILRSIFREVKKRDLQVVLKTRPIPVAFTDLRTRSAAEQQLAVEQELAKQRAPFLLGEGPLMRVALLQTDAEQAVVVWTYHRIILDEQSRNYVQADWQTLYQALLQGTELPQLARRSYKEYLSWVARQDWSPAKEYFAAQFAGFVEPTALLHGPRPVASEQSATDAKTVATCTLRLPEELGQALTVMAAQLGVAKSTVLQGAWALLLSVYSGEQRIGFGVTCAGRPHKLEGAAQIVGCLANTLPLFLQVDGGQPTRAFLQEVQAQALRLDEYAYIPQHEVLGYGDLANAGPLYTSSLAVWDAPLSAEQGVRLSTERVLQAPPNVLALDATIGREWTVTFAYATEQLTEATVARMMQHLQTVLESMIDSSERLVGELNVVPTAERAHLFHDFNQTKLPAPALDRLAHQVIEAQAARCPDALAAVCGAERVTYAELNERANRLAHWLRAQGFGRDDLAALLAERSIGMLIAIVAVLKAGGAYVPLDSAHPDARIQTVLDSSQAKVIFTQRDLAARSLELAQQMQTPSAVFCLDQADAELSVPDSTVLGTYAAENLPFLNEPHDLANVFFTSGSTGLPKGAMVEHIGMLNHLWAKINLLGLAETSIVVQNASHCFDISVWQFLAPLMVGGQVVIYPNDVAIDPQALFAAVKRDRVTVLEMVPALIEMFLQAAADQEPEARRLPDLAYMISTGEGLSVPLCKKWLQAYPDVAVVNTYGATECSDDTSHEVIRGACHDDDLSHVALGTPIPNFAFYLLDRWQRPVPIGCVGEVCMTGIGVGRGYLNDPERTASAFVQNPFADGRGERMYKTGDLARFLPDGRLAFVSRADFQVKVRGHRIELGEIEAALLRHPAVSQGVAIVRPDADDQNRILAYVVLTAAGDLNELRDSLQEWLPEYMLPEQIIELQALPLNRNGKVDRKALPDPEEPVRSQEAYVAPRNEVEHALVEIWSTVLGIEAVSIDDNFFSLGGHSLKTMQVRARIKKQFGVDMPLKTLFEYQTIRELSPLLHQSTGQESAPQQQTIPRLPQQDSYPMSHAQKRLYLIQRLEPHNANYELKVPMELHGALDVSCLQRAYQTIVDRHATLRTTFVVQDGQPVQRVAEQLPLPCPVEDLTHLSADACQQEIVRQIEAERESGFDLEKGPLFRIRLFKCAPERHVLLMSIHHIISDGWSGGVLTREFRALYNAYIQELPNPLPPLTIQYVDYAHWQNERLENGDLAEAEQYWLKQFAGEVPVLDLPTDKPRPAVQSFNGDTKVMQLDAGVAARFHQICQQQNATLFMGLLAVVGTFLGRLSGQDDVVIGTPEAGRNRMELEELIGFFINTLALRLDLSGNPTFLELLERVKQTALDGYAYQEYPFDLLVEKVNPVRDLSRSPLFSVMFQVTRGSAQAEEAASGLQVKPFPLENKGAHYDLSVSFYEIADQITAYFEYCTDLFAEATITRWMEHFHLMLEAVTAAPEQRIASLPLLSAADRQRLLVEWNRTEAEYARFASLPQLIEAQAERTPEATAVAFGETQLTYGELNARANQLARYLQRQGVAIGNRVGLCVDRSLDMLIGLLGILKAGAAYVPIDPTYPHDRLLFMLDDAAIAVLVTAQEQLHWLPTDRLQAVCLDTVQDELSLEATPNLDLVSSADSLAYVIYTSGSTGQPKGVQVAHRNVINFLQAMAERPGITAQDVLLAVTSFSFDIAGLELFLPLTVGAKIVLVDRETAANGTQLRAELEQYAATIMQATPITWRLLLAAGWENKGRVKMLAGGEAMPLDLAEQLIADGSELWNLYGPTETTIWSTIHHVQAVDTELVLIGRPIANTQVYVLDSQLQPVPLGVAGELYIGGAGVTLGYLNRPDLTAEKFVANPFDPAGSLLYRTGDRVRYLLDGNLQYIERIDNQVKIRGYRIELGEIESLLLQHEAVQEAVVTAKGEAQDKVLVGYVVLHQDQAATQAELQSFLRERLPDYMVPPHLLQLASLPLTPNGKIDRRALPDPDGRRAGAAQAAPRDQVELALAKLWESVLQLHPIGIEDNFFAIGGHSMKAMVLMGEIRRVFGVELPLALLFQKPTIAALADHLRGQTTATHDCLIPFQTGDTARPPLFLIHPQGGGVLAYFHLARALGADEPIYAVQSVGYESDEQPLAAIEEMAARYLTEIKRVAPQGSYRFAGWSFGGTVAFEMARQLEQAGETVDYVGLIDVMTMEQMQAGTAEGEQTERTALEQFAELLDMDVAALAERDDEEVFTLVLRRAKEVNIFPAGTTPEMMRRKIRVMMYNGIAMANYRCTEPIQADLHLYHATELANKLPHPLVDPQEWTRYTRGHVHATALPGDHHSLVNLPQVETLAHAMRLALQQAEQPTVRS